MTKTAAPAPLALAQFPTDGLNNFGRTNFKNPLNATKLFGLSVQTHADVVNTVHFLISDEERARYAKYKCEDLEALARLRNRRVHRMLNVGGCSVLLTLARALHTTGMCDDKDAINAKLELTGWKLTNTEQAGRFDRVYTVSHAQYGEVRVPTEAFYIQVSSDAAPDAIRFK